MNKFITDKKNKKDKQLFDYKRGIKKLQNVIKKYCMDRCEFKCEEDFVDDTCPLSEFHPFKYVKRKNDTEIV